MCSLPAETSTALRPVPRFTAGSASPIDPGEAPWVQASPRPLCAAEPQHFTEPSSRTAHVWKRPPVRATAERPVPTSTAGSASPMSETSSPRRSQSPRPSCPSWFSPQHFTVLSSRSAQLWASPETSAAAVRPEPRSRGGSPSPMSSGKYPRLGYPKPIAAPVPQHFTEPSSSNAQVWWSPAATAVTVRPVPRLTAGSASPIWPGATPAAKTSPRPSW